MTDNAIVPVAERQDAAALTGGAQFPGSHPGGDTIATHDAADLPVLLVHLDDPMTGAVSWKPEGVKDARWRMAKSIYHASDMADEIMPSPRIIDYVERKD